MLKIKVGISNGSYIRKLMNHPSFSHYLIVVKELGWNEFIWVVGNFLGNEKSQHIKRTNDFNATWAIKFLGIYNNFLKILVI